MASLLIHIGLPKTATTTLQKIYFPKVSEMNERIKYHGVFQPRESEQSELYRLIYKYVHTGNDLESCKTLLKSLLRENNLIHIVSEEMFVVSDNSTWRQKLSRLFQLLIGVDFKILVTIREPVTASFSYYTELYPIYKKCKLSHKAAILTHESMEIYKYKAFFKFIKTHTDKKSIVIIKFEDIIINELDGLHKLFNINSKDFMSEKLPRLNSKKATNKSIVKVEVKKLNEIVKEYTPQFVFEFIKRVLITSPSLKSGLINLTNRKINQKHHIKILSENDKIELENYFADDIRYLKDEFGVSFD